MVLIVVRPSPGDHHDLSGPQSFCGGLGGVAGAPAAQDPHLFPRHVHACPAGEVDEAVDVRVVAHQAAILVNNSVHRTDGSSLGLHLIAEGNHHLLIGDSHIEAPEVPMAEERLHLLRGRGEKDILIAP